MEVLQCGVKMTTWTSGKQTVFWMYSPAKELRIKYINRWKRELKDGSYVIVCWRVGEWSSVFWLNWASLRTAAIVVKREKSRRVRTAAWPSDDTSEQHYSYLRASDTSWLVYWYGKVGHDDVENYCAYLYVSEGWDENSASVLHEMSESSPLTFWPVC